MKYLFILLAVLIGTVANAQTDSPGCGSACYTVTDNSCSNQGTCNDWSSAETLTFTAGCTGEYTFVCKVDCEACQACGSCARLIEVSTGNVISRCQSTLDVHGSCEWRCDNAAYTGNPTLTGGTQYRLEVMLQICPVTPNCSWCWACTAKARVYHRDSNCTAW